MLWLYEPGRYKATSKAFVPKHLRTTLTGNRLWSQESLGNISAKQNQTDLVFHFHVSVSRGKDGACASQGGTVTLPRVSKLNFYL